MKNSFILSVSLILFFTGIMACTMESTPAVDRTDTQTDTVTTDPITNPTSNRLRIRAGASTFTATLLNNPTVTAFKARLPMTIEMSELNGNEKLYNFPQSLPTNSANPGTINTGDLMLYGSSTLVLFYKAFPTGYRYTKLGQIDNPAGLATALGTGGVTVSFALA